MYFFLCAHTGKGVWGRAEGSWGEAAASGSRQRAGGGMRVGPLPRAPRACHFGRFHDTGRGVGEARRRRAPPGCVPEWAPRSRSSGGERSRRGGGRRRGARGRLGPRIRAAGGTSPARRPCGPLRPCGLCAERAPESERASEREKYKYGRPRQWEKRPGHFLPAWAAENGLVECAGASPRRVLCVHGGKASPTPTAHTHTHTHAHTHGPAAGLGGREFAFSSSPPPPSRPTV